MTFEFAIVKMLDWCTRTHDQFRIPPGLKLPHLAQKLPLTAKPQNLPATGSNFLQVGAGFGLRLRFHGAEVNGEGGVADSWTTGHNEVRSFFDAGKSEAITQI